MTTPNNKNPGDRTEVQDGDDITKSNIKKTNADNSNLNTASVETPRLEQEVSIQDLGEPTRSEPHDNSQIINDQHGTGTESHDVIVDTNVTNNVNDDNTRTDGVTPPPNDQNIISSTSVRNTTITTTNENTAQLFLSFAPDQSNSLLPSESKGTMLGNNEETECDINDEPPPNGQFVHPDDSLTRTYDTKNIQEIISQKLKWLPCN